MELKEFLWSLIIIYTFARVMASLLPGLANRRCLESSWPAS